MAKTNTTLCHSSATIIDRVEPTSECLTGRAGLSLFVRYLRDIQVFPHLRRLFGGLRKSAKGEPVEKVLNQLFCFFVEDVAPIRPASAGPEP